MKAAVLHAPNEPMTIEDVSIEKPKAREVLLRTAAAGLCHSDLHFIEGSYPTPMPVVLGHECAGVVEAVGADVNYLKPGNQVIQGSEMGFIKFGSRVDLLLPLDAKIEVKINQKVKGGVTVLGKW